MRSFQGEGFVSMETAPQPPELNMVEEYSDQQYTFAGVTDTLPNLAAMCDHAQNADLDAMNKFAVRIINKNGGEVKEEHMPYIQEVVEAQGEEVKVIVKAESEIETLVEQPDYEAERAPIAETVKESESDTFYVHVEENELRRTREEVVDDSMLVTKQAARDQQEGSTAFIVEQLVPDEEISLQMNARLARMQQEYAESTYENDLSPEPLADEAKSQDVRKPTELEQAVEVVTLPTQPRTIAIEAPQPVIFYEDDSEIKDETVTAAVVIAAPLLREVKAVVIESSHVLDEPLAEDTVDVDEVFIEPAETELLMPEVETIMPGEILHLTEAPLEHLEVVEEAQIDAEAQEEIPEITLNELIPSIEVDTPADEPVSLMEQFQDYIKTDNELEAEVTEEASLLLVEIDSIVDEITELQVMADIETLERSQDMLENLEKLVENLLITLHIEYDEEIVSRITQTLIKQKYASKAELEEVELASPEEGTHERKFVNLQDLMFSVHSKLPNFRLLGRYAIRQETQLKVPKPYCISGSTTATGWG